MTPPRRVSDIEPIAERVPSPDGTRVAVMWDRSEYRMGWYDQRVAVADRDGRIVEDFEGFFLETRASPQWSSDSAWLVLRMRVSAGDETAFAFVAWRAEDGGFVAIRVGNPYPLDAAFAGPSRLRLQVAASQVAASNARGVFGGGESEVPVRRWRAPSAIEIDLDGLPRHARSELSRLGEIAAALEPIDLALIPDGFHPYAGLGLRSTSDVFNGRQLELHHLEAFAEHGDEVAREWLEEAKAKLGPGYDTWARVAPVLGKRKRPEGR